MPQFYGAAGIGEYDEVTGASSVSSFAVDIDPNVAISLVMAEWAFTTEGSSNVYGLLRVRNSSNTTLYVSNMTWTSTTTSALNNTNSVATFLNVVSLGAASNTSFTGEHFRAKMLVVNSKQTSIPFAHPTVYGEVSHESANGQTYNVCFSLRVRDSTSFISNLLILPQSGSVRWHRANSWSLADT